MKSCLALFFLSGSVLLAQEAEEGFRPIFDGKTLKGWHVSAQTGHSSASQHKTGGRWVVEEGVITGSQDIPGNGGIILTDEKFSDFEVVLEMRNDFGPDSGLFLRSTDDGTAYQAMIDYHSGGNLMGVYGEGKLGGKPAVSNFSFRQKVTEIITRTNSPVPMPVLGFLASLLAARPMERTPRSHREQPAHDHHLDKRGQIHGMDGNDQTAPGRWQHCPPGPWRRGHHKRVRPLPQRPCKKPQALSLAAPPLCGVSKVLHFHVRPPSMAQPARIPAASANSGPAGDRARVSDVGIRQNSGPS